MDKRLRWFDEGARTLRMVAGRLGIADGLPTHEEYYACPCCLVAYNRAAVTARVLTEEHVPPRSLGGRGLLLTCAGCNSNAGTKFDAHATRRLDAEAFMSGQVNGPVLPATFRVDGIPLRCTAQWTEGGLQLFGVPRQNNPEIQEAHFQALDAYVESGNPNPDTSFTVHTHFNGERARLSWIRSAYLVAFAALGWSYIFRSVMEPARQQLKQPDAEIIPMHILRGPIASAGERRILSVSEPDELRCILVMVSGHTVFLPGIFRPLSFGQLANAFSYRCDADGKLRVVLNGKELPWPRWPTYFLDGP